MALAQTLFVVNGCSQNVGRNFIVGAPLRLGAGYVGLSPLVELVDELEEMCQQRG